MLKKLFNSRAKNTTFAALIIGIATLLNGFLGLIRDRLFASRFGAGETLDIYFAAFRIPDFIYTLLFASGMVFVFLPIFSEYFHQDQKRAWRFANLVLSTFLVFAGVLCLLVLIGAPAIVKAIAPGFSGEKSRAVIQLTRLMLLSPFFFIISNIFSGILQYFDRFLVFSLTPLLYNAGIISGITVFYPLFGINGLALGVVLGAFLHMAIQIPSAVLAGFRYQPVFDFKSPDLKKVFVLLLPRTLAAAASQINTVVITAFASVLVSGSVAVFSLSNNLRGFPIILIGLSFATATFPYLSRAWAEKRAKDFLNHLFLSGRQTLFLIIPSSVFIFFLSKPLVTLVLGAGKFSAADIELTAASFRIFSLGFFAFALVPLLNKAFFSLHDTKTPLAAGLFSVVFNVIFCYFFVRLIGVSAGFEKIMRILCSLKIAADIRITGLSLGFLASGLVNFFLLYVFLHKKLCRLLENKDLLIEEIRETRLSLTKTLAAGLLMAALIVLVSRFIAVIIGTDSFFRLAGTVALIGLISGSAYLFFSFLLKSKETKTIFGSILKK